MSVKFVKMTKFFYLVPDWNFQLKNSKKLPQIKIGIRILVDNAPILREVLLFWYRARNMSKWPISAIVGNELDNESWDIDELLNLNKVTKAKTIVTVTVIRRQFITNGSTIGLFRDHGGMPF